MVVNHDALLDISDALRYEAMRLAIWGRTEYADRMETRLLEVANLVDGALPPGYQPSVPSVRRRIEARRKAGGRAQPMDPEELRDYLLDIRETLQAQSRAASSPSTARRLRAAGVIVRKAVPSAFFYDPDRKVRSGGAPLAPSAPRAKRVR